MAQARGVLDLTPGDCWPFLTFLYFCFIPSSSLYFSLRQDALCRVVAMPDYYILGLLCLFAFGQVARALPSPCLPAWELIIDFFVPFMYC